MPATAKNVDLNLRAHGLGSRAMAHKPACKADKRLLSVEVDSLPTRLGRHLGKLFKKRRLAAPAVTCDKERTVFAPPVNKRVREPAQKLFTSKKEIRLATKYRNKRILKHNVSSLRIVQETSYSKFYGF